MGVSGERISPDFALCTPRPPCLLPSLAASLTFAEYVGGLFENAPFGYAAMVSARRSCRNSRRSLPALLQWSHIRRPASMVTHCPPCLIGLTSAFLPRWLHIASLPRWFHICLPASMVTHCPPCLNGLTFPALPQWLHISRRTSMVSHFPPCLNGYTFASLPQWLHICLPASMVSHLPPCLNGYTFASLPHWLHICRRASLVTHSPPCFNGYTIPSTPHALTNCPATPSAPRKPLFCGLAAPLGTCSAPFVSCHPASRKARWGPLCADKMCVAVRHSH